jgi:hypothetical protein
VLDGGQGAICCKVGLYAETRESKRSRWCGREHTVKGKIQKKKKKKKNKITAKLTI